MARRGPSTTLSRLRAVAVVLVFVLFVISIGVFAFVIGDFLGDDGNGPDSGDTTDGGTPSDDRSDDGPENSSGDSDTGRAPDGTTAARRK